VFALAQEPSQRVDEFLVPLALLRSWGVCEDGVDEPERFVVLVSGEPLTHARPNLITQCIGHAVAGGTILLAVEAPVVA
jgi:hypothetical protein